MNAKKKNKKSHKPPNPNPPQNQPQNVESAPKIEEKIDESVPKCEVTEVLPPEIISDIAVTPVITSETKEGACETPKKPKRNKGKNKKQEKEENIEVPEEQMEQTQEQIESIPKTEESLLELVAENKECTVIDALSGTSVVPSARKKKNKKKSQEKPIEELKLTEELKSMKELKPIQELKAPVDDNKSPIILDELTEPTEKLDSEIQELFLPKPETPKQEGKKKKNKKKNRTDSERSDKSDNALSCTLAFQNILADETPKVDKPEITVESEELLCDSSTEKSEDKVIKADESNKKETIKDIKLDFEETKDLSKNESKGKKKNKKDKKQNLKETSESIKHDVSEEIPVIVEIPLTQTLLPTDSVPDLKESVSIPIDTQKEKERSPKPKAKIAKPVEKKRKGKSESGSSENLQSVEGSEILKEEKQVEEICKEPVHTISETPAVNIIEPQTEDQIKQNPSETPSLIDTINVPSEHTMGRKRKKSPKPKIEKEASPHVIQKDQILPVVVSEIKDTTEENPDFKSKLQMELIEPTKPSDHVCEEKPTTQKEPITEISTIIQPDRTVTPEFKKDNEGFETKTNRKKKKTPKIPQAEITSDMKEITEPIQQTQIMSQTKETCTKVEQISPEQANVMLDKHTAEKDIPTTVFEALSCDLIPDVQFVRSTSQQMLDNNNNTLIQEVMNVEEVKLSETPIPVIERSGASPIRTPELVSSGIRMTEVEAKTPTEEKTDLKSKMMEVNQEMEELRLSIERSLAGFTALEKIENEPEKELLFKKEKSPARDSSKETKVVEISIPEVKKNKETVESKDLEKNYPIPTEEVVKPTEGPPVCPTRKDNKGKSKSKKKGKQEHTTTTTSASTSEPSTAESKDNAKEDKKEKSEAKSEHKSESSQGKGKQQSAATNENKDSDISKETDYERQLFEPDPFSAPTDQNDFEPIESFEDALTSSIDDVNKTFEMIAKDADDDNIEFQKKLAANKPKINITTAEEDTNRNEKVNPVSQPKNLLGHTDIPVQSNRTDYKKEKNKTPNARQARVKIKDSVDVEAKKQSKESQTDNKRSRKASDKTEKESFSKVKNDNEEFIYKYSFRKVFLQSACHVCNKELSQVRVPCGYCNLIFYCGARHKDEDWPQHQALCFAVSTLAHMKDQKHIYADAAPSTGQHYRLLRMQAIVSCEKVLKRRLVPWEQELLLYPRMCAEPTCREWLQGKLKDCDGCGQLSFCSSHPDHLPKVHSRWCKSYSLYKKLVSYQQTRGRLEPRLPTRVLTDRRLPGNMNEILAALYEEKIDMNDIQYASLTQLATAPLTTAYCLQQCRNDNGISNGVMKNHQFTIHVVGAELQFEADALNKWETFFLHLQPDVTELTVVLMSPVLNPGNLPLDLLGKIKLCDNCQQNKRRVIFKFEDNKNYFEYRSSEDYINPDIICAFNPSIQRSSIYNGKDPWPSSIISILKLKTPFIITSYTLSELRKDLARIQQVSDINFKIISEPSLNTFASVRPDRNFISDDEMPLLFKNYCVAVVVGC